MSEKTWYRPLIRSDAARSPTCLPLAGGPLWFDTVECLTRGGAPRQMAAASLPDDIRTRLSAPRPPLCGLPLDRPQIMGVINTTPDSFSDGGQHHALRDAVAGAQAMLQAGATIIDIGGESTRPGADFVPATQEMARVLPVIRALREAGITAPISIDTRKAEVAAAALDAGADLFNDVSALSFDPESLPLAAARGCPVALMHAAGDPKTMQDNPVYADVLLDIYDYLETRVSACVAAGIERGRILVDPGIGFGKTLAHNLALVRGAGLLHALGCPILLGVSRKRFIGTLTDQPVAARRVAGSIAAGLVGLDQGVQVLRVHDVAETVQALRVWQALRTDAQPTEETA